MNVWRILFLRWYARRWPDAFERICNDRGIDPDVVRSWIKA